MLKYLAKRLLISVITFFGITLAVFFLSYATSGNPIDMLIDPSASVEVREALAVKLGLDQPVYVQYCNWLGQMLTGNMGLSYRTSQPVWQELMNRIGPTLLLTGTALVLALVISIPLGIGAAYKPYTLLDYVSSGLAFLGAAAPNFFIGLIFIYFFAVKLSILPNSGMYDNLSDKNLLSVLRHLILPASVLSLHLLGNFLRQMRSSMLECLNEDYINTARAKGMKERSVVLIHALKNAALPLVSQIGLSIPLLVGGTVVTEQIFSWPGIGSLLVLAISSRDYPMIMGVTSFVSLAVLLGNIVVDLIYSALDPRIRKESKKEGKAEG